MSESPRGQNKIGRHRLLHEFVQNLVNFGENSVILEEIVMCNDNFTKLLLFDTIDGKMGPGSSESNLNLTNVGY